MARYLISFEDGAMDFPEEDSAAVAQAAHDFREEAKEAGAFVFAGGVNYGVEPVVVDPDGLFSDGPFPESKELLGGLTIVEAPTRAAGLEWAARIAAGCRCAQTVRTFFPERDSEESAPYLISFDDGSMDFLTAEEWIEVGETAHAVIEEAKDAGVFICAGGMDYSPEDPADTPAWVGTVAVDGTVSDGHRPQTRGRIGGFTVLSAPDHEAALAWAAKIAVACRCPQDVRMFGRDPAVE